MERRKYALMDNVKCTQNYLPHLSSELNADLLVEKYTNEQEHCPSHKNHYRGKITYIQNPLFKNVTSKHFAENINNLEIISTSGGRTSDYQYVHCHKLFTPEFKFPNFQHHGHNGGQVHVKHKRRKDRLKARAESRRDLLINESSDEDHSSVNSTCELYPTNKRNSIAMDDGYNRRSRSARTERYFRRLSKEEGLYNNNICATKINSTDKIPNSEVPWRKPETQDFYRSNMNTIEKCNSRSYFSSQNDRILSNPIHNIPGEDTPTFYQKTESAIKQEGFTTSRPYSSCIDYNKTQRSDPSTDLLLAHKNNKSLCTLDRLQYVEPNMSNYQLSVQTPRQNKASIDPIRCIERVQLVHSKNPQKYETRSNIWLTMRRAPKVEAAKLDNGNPKNERKWNDPNAISVLETPSRSLDCVISDFQHRKLCLPREKSKLTVSDTNFKQTTELSPILNSNSTNLLSTTVNKDKIRVQKRSSKDLGKELSELEKMYNSLRLSDDNLLERAEERCVEELSQKGQLQSKELPTYDSDSSSSESLLENRLPGKEHLLQQSSEEHVKNDDMAYRKMNSKKMPALSETQNSLSQISYLLSSSAIILDKTDHTDLLDKPIKEEPNITKDDMVYRNFHYANNILKVVDPQPPFGIPLRPATPSTNSNYLCSSPVPLKSPPLKYVPQSEPNLVTDDLAFRNLRKDTPKSPVSFKPENNKNEANIFSFKNDLDKALRDDQFCKKKKKAVRSLSANLYGLIKEVNNLESNFI